MDDPECTDNHYEVIEQLVVFLVRSVDYIHPIDIVTNGDYLTLLMR